MAARRFFQGKVPRGSQAYLFAMVGGINHTHQVLVGPAIQVCILPADDAIACIARLTLTAEHGVTVMAQVVALGILVTVMCTVCTGVTGLAHLMAQNPDISTVSGRVPG